jgi:hypothetical protein
MKPTLVSYFQDCKEDRVLGTLFQTILAKEKRPELFPLSYLRKVPSLTSAFTEGRGMVSQTIHKVSLY